MAGLGAALAGLAEADGRYVTAAPDGWTQGRTLYGGITAALCAETARLSFPDLPPLRSAQFAFVGPAAGTLSLSADKLRQGRSSAVVAVDCQAEAGVAARALLTYGAARESGVVHDLAAMPHVPAPEDCGPFRTDGRPSTGFPQNFEIRFAGGARPMMAASEPTFLAWVRHLDDAGADPFVALLALADCLPPAAAAAYVTPGPVSTMTWTQELFAPAEPGAWHLLRSASEQARDGYSIQAMSLWRRDGRRIAAGSQTVAIFG
jgi:acyl-CoA thioesterase